MINDVLPPKAAPKQNQPITPINTAEFKTPEQVAAVDNFTVNVMGPKAGHVQSYTKQGTKRIKLDLTKRWEQVLLGVIVVIIGLVGFFGWKMTHHPKPIAIKKVAVVKKTPTVVVPTTVPSSLSGLPVEPSVNSVPVTGVMIENSTDARPQSGLNQASIVFEAIAEGGITRFLALYQDTAPTNVGPIRSVRPYYEQWALGFNAAIAHVGGSPEALANIKTWGIRDLDQFYNSKYYHRVTTRYAPHNVYTGIPTLVDLQHAKGFTVTPFTSFARKNAAPLKTPTANTINLTLSGPVYNVSYAYDTTTNSYKRSEGGAPHVDAETGAQLSPKVVIAMVMPYSLASDGKHSVYGTIGSGTAYVFQDGGVTTGTWAKASNNAQITFTDANGAPLALNAGQTWLTAVAKTTNVRYTP